MKRILVLLFIVLGILSFGDNSNFESFVNNAGYVEEVKKYDNSNGIMEKQAKEYLELLEFIFCIRCGISGVYGKNENRRV